MAYWPPQVPVRCRRWSLPLAALLPFRQETVRATRRPLVQHDPVRLRCATGIRAGSASVHDVRVTSRRADRILWHLVSSVRRRHTTARHHEQHRCVAGHRQHRPQLRRSPTMVPTQRTSAQRRQVRGGVPGYRCSASVSRRRHHYRRCWKQSTARTTTQVSRRHHRLTPAI